MLDALRSARENPRRACGRRQPTSPRRLSPSPSTAWEVIQAAASGSPSARAEFVQRYGAFIRQQLAARWQRSPLLAQIDDAQQEVFVECLKPQGVLARADASVPEGFRALLGAVVRNVALRTETRLQRQRCVDEVPASQLAADTSTVGRSFDRQWAVELLRTAAEEQARHAASAGEAAVRRVELLRLRFEEGLSIPDIAARWDRDASYVHHQYAKARADFQRALLAVLAARYPDLPADQLREQCQQLVLLLHSN